MYCSMWHNQQQHYTTIAVTLYYINIAASAGAAATIGAQIYYSWCKC